MDYSWVLSIWQVLHTHIYHLSVLASIKHTTGFTHKYLPLVSYYLRVQNCMTGVTCKYFNLSAITHSVLLMLHEPNMWFIFKSSQGMKHYLCFLETWMWAVLYGSYVATVNIYNHLTVWYCIISYNRNYWLYHR